MDNEFWRYRPYRGVREFVEEVQARTRGLLEPAYLLDDGIIEYKPIERRWGERKYTILPEGDDKGFRGITIYEIGTDAEGKPDLSGLVAWGRREDGVEVFSVGLHPRIHPRVLESRLWEKTHGYYFRKMELWNDEIGIIPRWMGQYLRDITEHIGGETRWGEMGWVRDM